MIVCSKLEEQYNNHGLRNTYGMRIKVSCLRNHQKHI